MCHHKVNSVKCSIQLNNDAKIVDIPRPGKNSMDKTYYSTLDNERLSEVSEKLGLADWRNIECIRENLNRYGKLPAHSIFKRHTLLCIPTVKCSKWKLAKLVDRELTNIIEMGICTKCNEPEILDDTVPMLL